MTAKYTYLPMSSDMSQALLVVCIQNAPCLLLYNVSCNSEMKQSLMAVVCLRHVAILVDLYYVLKLLCENLHLVDFHVSFKYQIKHQTFLVPTRRGTRRVPRIVN